MTMHTPGPWVVHQELHYEAFVVAGAYPYGSTICRLEDEPREGTREANARLIAAAPDLLGALEQIRGFASVMDESNWRDIKLHIQRQCSMIDKAEGK